LSLNSRHRARRCAAQSPTPPRDDADVKGRNEPERRPSRRGAIGRRARRAIGRRVSARRPQAVGPSPGGQRRDSALSAVVAVSRAKNR
jgi:hypothetical protein